MRSNGRGWVAVVVPCFALGVGSQRKTRLLRMKLKKAPNLALRQILCLRNHDMFEEQDKWTLLIGIPSLLFALIAIVVPLLWDTYRNRKAISYSVSSQGTLNVPHEVDRSELEIRYRGTEVTNPVFTVIEVRNSGRIPILPEDFKKSFSFVNQAEDARLLDVRLLTSRPENLRPELFVDEGQDSIILKDMLLNKGDAFRALILSDGVPEFKAEGRVVGTMIQELVKGRRSLVLQVVRMGLIGFLLMFSIRLILLSDGSMDLAYILSLVAGIVLGAALAMLLTAGSYLTENAFEK